MKKTLVIGAGIVGICTAIELRNRGYEVLIIDPNEPGSQTSYGNAGVITDTSLMIVNNPQILKSLFSLIFKKQTGFAYSKSFIFLRFIWVLRFLMFSNKAHMEFAARAYKELQTLSLDTHKKLIKLTNSANNVSKPGWLKLFKTNSSFDNYSLELDVLDRNNASYKLFDTDEIKKNFPELKEKFYKGVLFNNSIRIKSPQALSKKYFDYFLKKGGEFNNSTCFDLDYIDNKWRVYLNNNYLSFDEVVVCTGPWSKEFLSKLKYNIPLAWERGYHHHFSTKKEIDIKPAIHDVEGGFVFSANKKEIRLTSGVELNFQYAKANEFQVLDAASKLSNIIPIDKQITKKAWLGSRPTIVDSMPMIGRAPKHKNLWFNFGHNHIGLSTSTGSAIILADMLQKKKKRLNTDPFAPQRFIL
ncbi:FAD-binding oxidoreductase [Alphaproteobacteria bacterium]|nr:FAD-binding oxidoreductase [Alphaproteobacteria bacterium]